MCGDFLPYNSLRHCAEIEKRTNGMEKFCDSLTAYKRRDTLEVRVGSVVIGGGHPVRIQSMTNTDTNDTAASVAQIRRIADAGGEIVRLTAQGRREAANLADIHARLRAEGYDTPLVADIHFVPEAALTAAEHVEKVRINPGNFNDKGGQFDALLAVCRRRGAALRIGVNHGSLAPEIMERYGDTPEGMVASAMGFLRRCRDAGFAQVVVSMKSSNVRVMVYAYRMLAAAMRAERMDYPLHLGVTEAGDAEDGRVKSAVGIGALLADGIGDTIRVSLTEAPEREIPVACKLAGYFAGRERHAPIPDVNSDYYSPYRYRKRLSDEIDGIGGNRPVAIWSEIPERVRGRIMEADIRSVDSIIPGQIILLTTNNINGVAEQRAFFLRMAELGLTNPVIVKRSYAETDLETLQIKAAADTGMLFLDGFGDGLWIENRAGGAKNPDRRYGEAKPPKTTAENQPVIMDSSTGGIQATEGTSGRGREGAEQHLMPAGSITPEQIDSLSLGILQAARVRISKAEYIACPGCGRTLYDIEKTLREIREKTGHLTGIKIGVMGCIVNGPGEMADADYGYVGAGAGRITLYKGQRVIRRNIPSEEAIDALIALIKANGDWRERE